MVNSIDASQIPGVAAAGTKAAGTKDAGNQAACARTAGARTASLLQPALAMRSPVLVTSRYSTPGSAAATCALSAGVSTENAVAMAPASAGFGAATVELTIASAVRPVRGSTMCE